VIPRQVRQQPNKRLKLAAVIALRR